MPVVLGSGKIYANGNYTQLPKIWVNSKLGHYGFQGSNWDWSNLRFSGVASSFKFVPDPDDGGLQGDFSIGTGSADSAYPAPQDTYDLNSTIYEIEPAGGTGQFDMMSRELSYTLKFGPIITSYQYTKADNVITFSECKFLMTAISSSSQDINRVTRIPADYKTTGATYIQDQYLDVQRPSTPDGTNIPSKTSSSDYTLSFSIGPNNTPEAAYTDVVLTGFSNESLGWERFQKESTFGTYTISNTSRNTPWPSCESERSDTTTHSPLSRTMPKNMTLLRIWQRPNILYYVHMKFINLQYVDYDNPPPTSQVLESWSVNWQTKDEQILVYIEFGVSPNGGKTIWWNGVEADSSIGGTVGAKLRTRGITTVVPDDINKYMTATLLNYSVKPSNVNGRPGVNSSDNRYNISTDKATVHGSKAFKYVRIPIWTDLVNDEYANNQQNRWQKYECINFEGIPTSTTETGADDSDIDKTTHLRLNDYWSKWKINSESAERYQIGRKNRTNPWSTNIHLELFYKKDSLKYIGATDGKTVVSKS